MSVLSGQALSYHVKGGTTLVDDASFVLEPGSLTALIGPNGAGKTTLLRMALGILEPTSGRAFLNGKPLQDLSPSAKARQIAYLPQKRPLVWAQPVRDVVALGRFAFGGPLGQLSAIDEAAVERAITACHLHGFEHRAVDTLSGGELARVHLARALATEADILVADEPVAALDPRSQHQSMQIFQGLARAGRSVLTVIHDLDLAFRYADRLIWMKDGKIVADGTPVESATPERLRSVFGVEGELVGENADLRLSISGPA